MSADALPFESGCKECDHFTREEQRAREERNPSREVDVRVRARRHLRTVHGVVSVVRA